MNTLKLIGIVIVIVMLHPAETYCQTKKSEAEDLPMQYRRGIPLQEGYQSYDEKYSGENLEEIKRSLFPLESTGVWTELNPKVPRVSYLCVDFVGVDTGWAVGELGAIIYTTNGGNKWNTALSGVNNVLLNVNSYDGKTVIVTGYSGIILRSTDAGKSWTQIPSGVTADLWRVQMINDSLGWACGLNNTLLKTTDAGLTWVFINTITTAMHYWAVTFLNENTGYIACGNGNILKTINGGINWETIYVGENIHLFTITVFDTSNFIAGGQRSGSLGRIAYTSDGGNTFGYSNAGGLVESIGFANDTLGYAVGEESVLYRTTNKGRNWQFINYFWVGRFWVKFINENLGYQAGHGLRINQTTDRGYNWKKSINNENFNDVYFTSEVKGFLIGSDVLYKTTDGGISIDTVAGAPGGSKLLFIDGLTGFLGGHQTKIFKSVDGGNNWYATSIIGLIDTVGWITRFFFINSLTGWATTTRGDILKTTNAGENWFAQLNAGAGVYFSSIHLVDSLYGWTANSNLGPYFTTNGGNTWTQQTQLNFFQTGDVFFYNHNQGWISDVLKAKLYKTLDGGINWFLVEGVQGPSKFHFFPNIRHWIISGANYYETKDSGSTWVNIINKGFSSFHAPEEWLGYATGAIGLILNYFDSTVVPVELVSFTGYHFNNKVYLSWITVSETNNLGFEIERSVDGKEWIKLAFIKGSGSSIINKEYFFEDNLVACNFIRYRLKQIDYNGSYDYLKEIKIKIDIDNFYLYQNFPNPFNSSTIINYQVPEKSLVNISFYNIKGERILELVKDEKDKGLHNLELKNNILPSGIYFVRMTTSTGYSAVIKITIIK